MVVVMPLAKIYFLDIDDAAEVYMLEQLHCANQLKKNMDGRALMRIGKGSG